MRKEDYDLNEARADYIARMEAEGNTVVYPASNELQLDIDSEEDYLRWMATREVLDRNKISYEVVSEKPSRSGLPKRHIIIELPSAIDPWQRIAMQAAFGSDHIRELLSCIRLMRGDDHPTLLVEKGLECGCPSHHTHGPGGAKDCVICNPPPL